MTREAGAVRAGMALVWHRPRILWWLYAFNLLFALFGTLPVARLFGKVLDHSLAADRLYSGFDLTAFMELLSNPDVPPLGAPWMASFFFALVFFGLMLFFNGGILDAYRRERRPTIAEFFQACGSYFWRFVRLLLVFLIVVGIFLALAALVRKGLMAVAGDFREALSLRLQEVEAILLLLGMMAARLWFDMAQVRTVLDDQPAVRRTLLHSFKLTSTNFGTLFWIYLRITLVAWAVLLAALWIWVKWVPPQRAGLSFFLGQGILWVWLATRLWQRASEVVWYQRHQAAQLVEAALADFT